MKVERPPEIWDARTEDTNFVPLLGEMIATALSKGAVLGELTLNASNVVVEDPKDEGSLTPPSGEYVAVTVSGATDFGPDDRWLPQSSNSSGLLHRLRHRLNAAEARFAYVRRAPQQGSFTVFFARTVADSTGGSTQQARTDFNQHE
jgi:hypothetical protein